MLQLSQKALGRDSQWNVAHGIRDTTSCPRNTVFYSVVILV